MALSIKCSIEMMVTSQIRLAKNLSQAYIASQIGVSPEWYCKMENGKTRITMVQIEKIASILQVNVMINLDNNVELKVLDENKSVNHNNEMRGQILMDYDLLNKILLVLEKINTSLDSKKLQ